MRGSIYAKKIIVAQSSVLVEKMCSRIIVWSSRNLSYVGRLQLINLVFLSIHVYWAQVYILHKSILKEIENMWRPIYGVGSIIV